MPLQRKDNRQIKIAVLDTGVDLDNPVIKNKKSRVECMSFLEDGGVDDLDGHGTHVVQLMLRVSRNAKIYVARVFRDDEHIATSNIARVSIFPARNMKVY